MEALGALWPGLPHRTAGALLSSWVLPAPIQTALRVLSSAQQEGKLEAQGLGKNNTASPRADDLAVYVENPRNAWRNLQEQMAEDTSLTQKSESCFYLLVIYARNRSNNRTTCDYLQRRYLGVNLATCPGLSCWKLQNCNNKSRSKWIDIPYSQTEKWSEEKMSFLFKLVYQ